MKSFRTPVLTAFAIIAVGTVILLAAPQQEASKRSEAQVDAYFKLHQDVLDTLRTSFGRQHPLINAERKIAREAEFSWPQMLKDHAKHQLMTAQYDGQHVQKFTVLLNINSDAITGNQGNSETMTATTILNHLFSPLEQVGFRNQGSPSVTMSAIQYASNIWFPRDRFEAPQTSDSPAWVEAEVFYAPHEAQAVVRICVGGRFVP